MGLVADAPKLIRSGDRQRLQHHLLHEREDRRGCADAQRQSQHRRQRKARCFAQLAKGVANILQKQLKPHGSASLAAVFLNLLDPAELDSCEPAGFALRYAGTNLVGDLKFEVEAQLFVQIGLHLFAKEKSP